MAAYTWVGTTSNWSTGSNWTPAAPAGGPTSADTATVNNTAACTVTANSSCLTLIFTGYTGTFTINSGFTLTVFGTAITLATGMTYDQTTTGILSTRGNQAAITITFAGITIPNLTLGKTGAGTIQTVTISGAIPTIKNLVITNGFSNSNTTLIGAAITITSSLLNTQGVLTNNTGQIIFSGSCTISSSISSAIISGGFNVTTGSSLQMISDVYLQPGVVTFTGTATLNAGAFTLSCNGSMTFNTGTINWYNLSLTQFGATQVLLSALNISNDLIVNSVAFSGAFPINVSGSVIAITSIGLGNSALNMLGTGTIEMATSISTGTININTSNPLGYTLGSATRPNTILNAVTINLVGTSVVQLHSTTLHRLNINGVVLSTNNTVTGANIVGGTQIIWNNISLTGNSANTLTYDTIALGDLSANASTINGAKLYVAGNLSATSVLTGTATIELDGLNNATWSNGTYQNNIFINKSGGAVVTTGTAITWGAAGRSLTMNTTVNFATNSTTFTLSGATLTINNSIGNSFFNLTIPASTVLTLSGATTPITNNLTVNGSVTFTGTAGWICGIWLCSVPGAIIVLQSAITYTTTTNVAMLGTNASRITIRSNAPTVSYAIWTLQNPATQSMVYVNGQGVDSEAGMTIYSFGGTILTSLRALNWYNGASQGTKAFTYVS